MAFHFWGQGNESNPLVPDAPNARSLSSHAVNGWSSHSGISVQYDSKLSLRKLKKIKHIYMHLESIILDLNETIKITFFMAHLINEK